LRKLLRFKKASAAPAVIVFHELADKSLVSLFGVAELDSRNRVVKFQEKPRPEEAISSLASTAVYVLGRDFVERRLPEFVNEKRRRGERPDVLGEMWKYFIEKIPVRGFTYQGVWGDLNTCESYVELNKQAMNLMKKSRIDGTVHSKAVVREPVIIERGAVVARNAVVGPYVHLLAGARVGEDAFVSGSIVFDGAEIGAGASVKDSLVDGCVSVGARTHVDNYCMLGYGSRIGRNARLLAKSTVWPFVEIGDEAVVEGRIMVPEECFKRKLDSARFWLQ